MTITGSSAVASTESVKISVKEMRGRLQHVGTILTCALLLVAVWLLTHRYDGITSDARLYAIQAVAKIHPAFNGDLYLQNVSQDRYTFFSTLYAFLIRLLGLQQAAKALFVVSEVGFLLAAWTLARTLSNRDVAWLSVGMLVITVGSYGAFGIFNFSENYLTARSLAEALVVFALGVYFRGLKPLALLIGAGAMLVHPLMALPGLLLMISLWLPLAVGAISAVIGIGLVLGLSMVSVYANTASGLLTVIDAPWLEVVRERSQFLFLQLWTVRDWQVNARPFLSLALSCLILRDYRIQRLCSAAMLVGIVGLAIAFTTSVIGPVAIFMQGQAWRWVWVTSFVGVLVLVPTAVSAWQDQKCGILCSLLVVLAWTFSEVDHIVCIVLAAILWLTRPYISHRVAGYLRWAAIGLTCVVAASVLANSYAILASPFNSGREALFLQRTKGIALIQIPVVALGFGFWRWILKSPTPRGLTTSCGLLLAFSAYAIPSSFNPMRSIGSSAEVKEFADWRVAIPQTSSVYVANAQDLASFAWFTLERPSYLSIDQSAGVVYSRATSLEIRRRSEVLSLLRDEDWRQLSRFKRIAAGTNVNELERVSILTREKLVKVCQDRQLGFLISQQDVGFTPVRHKHPGPYQGWNLYDCDQVRSQVATQ